MTTLSMKDLLSILKSDFKNIRWKIEFILFKKDSPIERIESDLLITANEEKDELLFVGECDCDRLKWCPIIEWMPSTIIPKGEYPYLYLITEYEMGIRDHLLGSYHNGKFIRFGKNEQGTMINIPVENVKFWANAIDPYSIGEHK